MLDYLGYIIVFLLLLVCFLIYLLLFYIERKRITNYFERERKKIQIVSKLISIAEEVEKKTLKETPNIEIYLKQANFIIQNKGFSLEDIEISTLSKYPDNAKCFDKEAFCKEYSSASKTVKNMVIECSETLGLIYQLDHPLAYAYNEFKKNMLLQILLFLVKKKRNQSKRRAVEVVHHRQMGYGFINEVSCV